MQSNTPTTISSDIQQYMSNKYNIKLPKSPINPQQQNIHNTIRCQDQQFFQYVRNKKYKQAYTLGQSIISKRPNNKAISGFCQYILKNMLEEADQENNLSSGQQSKSCSDSQEQQDQSQQQQEQQQVQKQQKIKKQQQQQSQQTSSQQSQQKQQESHQIIPTKPQKQKQKQQTLSPKLTKQYIKPIIQKQNRRAITYINAGSHNKQNVKNIVNIKFNQQNSDSSKKYLLNKNIKNQVKLPEINKYVSNITITQSASIQKTINKFVIRDPKILKVNLNKDILSSKNQLQKYKQNEGEQKQKKLASSSSNQNAFKITMRKNNTNTIKPRISLNPNSNIINSNNFNQISQLLTQNR